MIDSLPSQKSSDRAQQLEGRVSALEAELAELLILKELLADSPQQEPSWWTRIAGSFEDDPTFEEAAQLGRDWRQSAD
ncbi:MAG: hypothetical protein HC840_31900 [Leptolyngbyaceae cyanobacterium RM2_2_4]|nr:hypothetical protein [bacterium]NJO53248.1 hypothetical protein [Leptolyngbyaceae cyanobacterium RM2_2_4]